MRQSWAGFLLAVLISAITVSGKQIVSGSSPADIQPPGFSQAQRRLDRHRALSIDPLRLLLEQRAKFLLASRE